MFSVLKFFSENAIFFSLFCDFDVFFPGLLAIYFQVGGQNWMLHVCSRLWGKTIKKDEIFYLFRSLNGNFSAFCQTLSSENFKIASIVSTRKFWGKKPLVKIIVFSTVPVHWAKTVWPSRKNLVTGLCLNRILRVHKKTFRKKFRDFKSFSVLGVFEGNIFCRSFTGGIVITGFYVSVEKIWWNWRFS